MKAVSRCGGGWPGGGDEAVMKTADEVVEDHLAGLALRQVESNLREHGVNGGFQGRYKWFVTVHGAVDWP